MLWHNGAALWPAPSPLIMVLSTNKHHKHSSFVAAPLGTSAVGAVGTEAASVVAVSLVTCETRWSLSVIPHPFGIWRKEIAQWHSDMRSHDSTSFVFPLILFPLVFLHIHRPIYASYGDSCHFTVWCRAPPHILHYSLMKHWAYI